MSIVECTRGPEQGLLRGYSKARGMLVGSGHCLQCIAKRLKPTRGQVPKRVGGVKKGGRKVGQGIKKLGVR